MIPRHSSTTRLLLSVFSLVAAALVGCAVPTASTATYTAPVTYTSDGAAIVASTTVFPPAGYVFGTPASSATLNSDGSVRLAATIPISAIPAPTQTLKESAEAYAISLLNVSRDKPMYTGYTGPRNPKCVIAPNKGLYAMTSFDADGSVISVGDGKFAVLMVTHQRHQFWHIIDDKGRRLVATIDKSIVHPSVDYTIGIGGKFMLYGGSYPVADPQPTLAAPSLIPSTFTIQADTPLICTLFRDTDKSQKVAINRYVSSNTSTTTWGVFTSGTFNGASLNVVGNESGSAAYIVDSSNVLLLGLSQRSVTHVTDRSCNLIRSDSTVGKWIQTSLKAEGLPEMKVADLNTYKAK